MPPQRSAVFTTVSTAAGTHFSPAPHPIHCSRQLQWMECGVREDDCWHRRQSVVLADSVRFGDQFLRNETGHRFEKRVPVTRLPFYNLSDCNAASQVALAAMKLTFLWIPEVVFLPLVTHQFFAVPHFLALEAEIWIKSLWGSCFQLLLALIFVL